MGLSRGLSMICCVSYFESKLKVKRVEGVSIDK